MLNRGKNDVKKNVFGGGLEAARAKQTGGGPPKPPPVQQPPPSHTTTYSNTAAYNRPPPGRSTSSNQSQPKFYPPPLEAEVVELSFPPRNYEPPDESSIALNSGISREEAARREEERVGKSIGKFAIPTKSSGELPPPPPPSGPKSTNRGPSNPPSYGGGSPHGQSSYGGGSPHGQSSYGGGSSSQNQPPSFGGHNRVDTHANVSHGHDYVYPDFQIGVITPVDNNTTVLPLSPMGCNAHELSLNVRQNGKQLEVRRSVNQKGAPRSEQKNINLPFQVFAATTTASYNPNKNGGELAIFFGKPAVSSGSGRDSEICQFTVYANPNSSDNRVPIAISQSTDSLTFRPERPSMYDTTFTVVQLGSVLEFRSVCIFEDDEGVKTLNAKQTVNLPITPTRDQIETNGDEVIIWINRTVESTNVGDFEVHIAAGH
jgi:hypothetical protein